MNSEKFEEHRLLTRFKSGFYGFISKNNNHPLNINIRNPLSSLIYRNFKNTAILQEDNHFNVTIQHDNHLRRINHYCSYLNREFPDTILSHLDTNGFIAASSNQY